MRNRFSLKKTIAAFSAGALLLTAGIPGLSAITAWALPSSGVVTEGSINVRASAVDGEVLDTLSEGRTVSIVDSTTDSDGNTWYQIQYTVGEDMLDGWVRADLLTVEGDDTEEASGETTEEAVEEEITEEEETREDVDAVASSAGGVTYVIASSIPTDVIPDGFQQTTVSYEGKEVPALVMNNASVYLLYMEDASNTAPGRLVVYDMTKSELIPYINFETKDGFILLLNIPDAEIASVSDRFVLTTCEFDSGTMDALQMTQSDAVIAESANLTEYYYMYGVNRDGMYGWYVYDYSEGTIQSNILSMHYNLNGTTVDEEEEGSGFSLDSLSVIVIIGIIVVLLLLVVLVIIFGIRYRQLAKEMDEMESKNAARSHSKSSGKKSSASSRDYNDYDRYGSGGSSGSTYSPASSQKAQSTVSGDTHSFDYFSSSGNSGSSTGSTGGSMNAGMDSVKTEPLGQAQEGSGSSPRTAPKPERHTDPDDDDLEFL